MSNTPKLADECKRLLDNGWVIQLYRNGMRSYTAVAMPPALVKAFDNDDEEIDITPQVERILADPDRYQDRYMTDDFEPSQALYRLTEKVFGNIA